MIPRRAGCRWPDPPPSSTSSSVASTNPAELHDVGKIGVPEELPHKSGPLTDEEYARVREHVRIGVEIPSPLAPLATIELLSNAAGTQLDRAVTAAMRRVVLDRTSLHFRGDSR